MYFPGLFAFTAIQRVFQSRMGARAFAISKRKTPALFERRFRATVAGAVLLGAMPYLDSATAASKTGGIGVTSLAVRVGDDPSWKPTESECRRWPNWAPSDICAKYGRASTAPEKPRTAPAQAIARDRTESAKGRPDPLSTRSKREQEQSFLSRNPPIAPKKASVALPASLPGGAAPERVKKIIGQLLLSGFEGKHPGDTGVVALTRALRTGEVSGVIVRGSNIENYRQLRELIAHIGKAAGDESPLIAIDQPGGPDSVLLEEKGFLVYSAANSVRNKTPYEAQVLYRSMAAELSALGVNLNIGPAGDVCRETEGVLPPSCFGTTPGSVGAFARAFSFGHHDRGVLSALRRTAWQPSMMGNQPSQSILNNAAQDEISDAIVLPMKATALLRLAAEQPGFLNLRESLQDLGPTDAFLVEMETETNGTPIRYGDGIVEAFRAGADMVVIRDPSRLPSNLFSVSFDAVFKSVEEGSLPLARLEEAYRHVLRLKHRLGS